MSAEAVADAFARAMAAVGTRAVFGLPGGGNNLEVVGALRACGVEFVLAHTETAAAIMAAVYADIARMPSAVVVTRGPGAASVVNGAAQALLDRQPVIVLTDAVAERDRPRIRHQFLDQRSLFAPVTKSSGVLSAVEPDATTAEALDRALTPPRGPVHLDFDPTAAEHGFAELALVPDGHGGAERSGELSAVRDRLAAARRPVALLGVGARDARAEIRQLLGGSDVPTLVTYRAKGVIPESWDNFAGLLTGATMESAVLESADLLLAIGMDTVELIPAGWPYPAPLVSLTGWPEPSNYLPVAHEVVGDLAELVPSLHGQLRGEWARGSGQLFRQDGLDALARVPDSMHGVSPQGLVSSLRATARAGTIATVDAGAHMLAALPLWECAEADEAVVSSGLATMGFALPAAIGAAVAAPGRRVVCFVGDGGLGMVLAELETLVRLRLPVTVVVFNDSRLSLIAVKQTSQRHGGDAAVRYDDTDFRTVAMGFGLRSYAVSSEEDLASVAAAALSGPGPCLLDARVDPGCYPLVLDAVRGARRPPADSASARSVAASG